MVPPVTRLPLPSTSHAPLPIPTPSSAPLQVYLAGEMWGWGRMRMVRLPPGSAAATHFGLAAEDGALLLADVPDTLPPGRYQVRRGCARMCVS